MEMITTSTSGRDGGQSREKVNKTRRLCLSNTVTGNKLPEICAETREEKKAQRNMRNERENCTYDKTQRPGWAW